MRHIPEIQENLDCHKNIKLHLEGDLYVISSEITDLMYLGLCWPRNIQDTGINLTMEEFTEVLAEMESLREVNESHPSSPQFHIYNLIL